MSDRKYKQRGYQETDAPRSPRPGAPAAPRERPEGPRGRGLGAPTAAVFRCGECGQKVEPPEVALASQCPHCAAPLHACIDCAHFDSAAPKECRQPIGERVARKRAANACALFSVKLVREVAAEPARPAGDDPRSAFDALFKI